MYLVESMRTLIERVRKKKSLDTTKKRNFYISHALQKRVHKTTEL